MAIDEGVAVDQVKQAFGVALDLSSDADFESLVLGAHPAWDSVAHMTLVAELEERFDVMLEVDDIVGISSYHATLDVLRRYGVGV